MRLRGDREDEMNTNELRKAASCVFLVTDEISVAQDLSDKLIWAADEIDKLHGDMESKSKVLEMIATDMKNDAKKFDGRPFNGKTVAEYLGNQGAAIAALANIVKSIVETEGSK